MENRQLTKKQFMSVSVMLFGLFFGAGNLIFPPLLGYRAGYLTFSSLLFFAVTAVIFPILGIVAVARTKGLSNLANRVNPTFSIIFTSLIYLSIGPGLGIPRAGSVPFEMAILPYLPAGMSVTLSRVVYTSVFFLVAYVICLKPNKLVNRMGKFLTPCLLLLILIMFLSVVFKNPNMVLEPTKEYLEMHRVTGFLNGYDTMDTIAALNFGLVISLAIQSFKVTEEKAVISYSIKAGLLAGSFLFIVYAMLSYVGMTTAGLIPDAQNGAQILTAATQYVFGLPGALLLAMIFTLACLTTCVGLITSGSQYFATLCKERINYRQWVIIWTLFSFIVANFGLNTILAVSVPILVGIYPVSILLIILALTHRYLQYSRLTYNLSVYVCVFVSVMTALTVVKVNLPVLSPLVAKLPFYQLTLGWVLPTAVVLVFCILYDFIRNRTE